MLKGISVCGSGVGAFVMAPLVRWLVNTYDWKVRKKKQSTEWGEFKYWCLLDCSPCSLGNLSLLRTFWRIDKAARRSCCSSDQAREKRNAKSFLKCVYLPEKNWTLSGFMMFYEKICLSRFDFLRDFDSVFPLHYYKFNEIFYFKISKTFKGQYQGFQRGPYLGKKWL